MDVCYFIQQGISLDFSLLEKEPISCKQNFGIRRELSTKLQNSAEFIMWFCKDRFDSSSEDKASSLIDGIKTASNLVVQLSGDNSSETQYVKCMFNVN